MSANPWDLTGRVALVTGASSGIGRATAKLLAERGAKVMAVARDAARLASLAREATVEIEALSLDSAEGCARAIDVTRKRLGPIAILVNNAGRGGFVDRPVWQETAENWRQTMAVNLDAPFELTRLAAGDMQAMGWGRIVMVSSTAGEVGAPAMTAYCGSKHGVIGLMRAVAHDLGRFGGTCNAVLPGWVRTEMAERDAEAEAARRGRTVEAVWKERDASYPRGRVLEPIEIARIIAFLASEDGAGINGEALTVALGGLW